MSTPYLINASPHSANMFGLGKHLVLYGFFIFYIVQYCVGASNIQFLLAVLFEPRLAQSMINIRGMHAGPHRV